MTATASDLGTVELVTITEAAEVLGVKPWAVYERAASGDFGPVYRDGPRLLVERGRLGRERLVEHHLWPLSGDA